MIHPLLTLHTRARSLGVLAAALTACGGAPGDAGAGPASPGVAIAISAVTPPAGPSAGATPVTVEGTGFEAGVRVRFGGVEAAQVSVAGPTRLVAVAPAHAPGQVDVEVIDANLQTATLAGGFTYLQAPPPSPTAPAVAGVAPASGPVSGNTVVTLTGTGFVTGSTVTIGGTAAIMGAVTATRITVTTPGGPAGPANVTVTNPDRQSTTLVGGFTYLAAPPVVTAINVRGSPQAGGGLMLLVGAASRAPPT
ncbi:MAG TPA: IPT/TIG domain-containing protein [Anaeromyxobacter sp.]